MRIEFHYKEYTCCTYIHACIHKCTYCTPDVVVLLTPSQCQIEEDPLLIVCSKHFHQKEADEYSFTQCPGEGGQEEVVHEGCHNLAGSLVKRSEEKTLYTSYTVNNTETYILHCILHTCNNLVSLLTGLFVASCIPKMNTSSPKERATHKLK